MLNKYEIVTVYDADLDEEGIRAQLDKVTALLNAHQGRILREELLGRQQLSYPMKKRNSGIYVILVVECLPTFVAEFTRQMRIADEVLRFSCVKKDKFAPDFVKREERSRGDSRSRPRDEGRSDDSPKKRGSAGEVSESEKSGTEAGAV